MSLQDVINVRYAGEPLEPFGQDAVLDHIGIAVSDVSKVPGKRMVTVDSVQRVKLAFLRFHGVPVELVEPAEESSPVSRLLKNDQHLYHLCFRVPNLEASILEAKRHGFHRLSRPVPAPALAGKRIVWLFSKEYGLYELVEE